jgi:hypothetical protein
MGIFNSWNVIANSAVDREGDDLHPTVMDKSKYEKNLNRFMLAKFKNHISALLFPKLKK